MVQTSSPIEIGQRIRRLRREQNFTQEDVAKKMQVTRATINKYEAGIVNFPRNRLEQLAEILGVSPAYLLGWTTERSAEYKPQKPRPLFDPNSSQTQSAPGAAGEPKPVPKAIELYSANKTEGHAHMFTGANLPEEKCDPILSEIQRIYSGLTIKDKNKLLTFAYELEEKKCAQ